MSENLIFMWKEGFQCYFPHLFNNMRNEISGEYSFFLKHWGIKESKMVLFRENDFKLHLIVYFCFCCC
uniref:Uncharacterized protein n=1 Tax=Arundo donax TaxID=35708 RepID=A0A0A9BR26_ARUDO